MPERAAPITPEEVAHVARLARLAIGDEELARYTADLAAVLGHAADLAALDLDGVEPTAHPLPLRNVDRPDEVRPGLRREEALAGAPDVAEGRYFRVPRILGDDG